MDPIHYGCIVVVTRDLSCEMTDSRDTFNCISDIVEICYRAFHRFHSGVFHPFRRRRSHYSQVLFTGFEQLTYKMNAQEPGTAGDQDLSFDLC
jgi:hypothetical protein